MAELGSNGFSVARPSCCSRVTGRFVERPTAGFDTGYRDLEAEIAALRADNVRLRAVLAPGRTLPLPARWALTPQQAQFLTLLHGQAGCVSYARLATALGGPARPLGRAQLQVIACHLRRKTAPFGVAIETYRGAGYGLTPKGRAALNRAIAATTRWRRA